MVSNKHETDKFGTQYLLRSTSVQLAPVDLPNQYLRENYRSDKKIMKNSFPKHADSRRILTVIRHDIKEQTEFDENLHSTGENYFMDKIRIGDFKCRNPSGITAQKMVVMMLPVEIYTRVIDAQIGGDINILFSGHHWDRVNLKLRNKPFTSLSVQS